MNFEDIYATAQQRKATPEWVAAEVLSTLDEIAVFYAEYVSYMRTHAKRPEVRADPGPSILLGIECAVRSTENTAKYALWKQALPKLDLFVDAELARTSSLAGGSRRLRQTHGKQSNR